MFLVDDMDMGALMTVCTLSITLLMVYGAVKGKGSHLLPFFCLQMFDFAITTYVLYIIFFVGVKCLFDKRFID